MSNITQAVDDSPEAKMARRYPQPVLVGALMRYPFTEFDRRSMGDILHVARTPAGKIELIVLLNHRFGWSRRMVAIPIEVVGIRGVEVVALDINSEMVRALPTWTEGADNVLATEDSIRIALTKS
jgi:hypothetical protein